jgi:hypothetical protein
MPMSRDRIWKIFGGFFIKKFEIDGWQPAGRRNPASRPDTGGGKHRFPADLTGSHFRIRV